MSTPLGILTAARAKIAQREHWCIGKAAITVSGACVAPWSRRATTWCAAGAIYACPDGHGTAEGDHAYDLLDAAAIAMRFPCVETLNDWGGHVMVMLMYDRAIAAAAADEAAQA
jgi:hypothetical protein